MLGLKLPTDPRWVNIVEKNIEEILTDHAYCEQKAASTAISLIVTHPEYSELVTAMTALAREEMGHFKMVHDRILERGLSLGRDRKDEYVVKLMTFSLKVEAGLPISSIDCFTLHLLRHAAVNASGCYLKTLRIKSWQNSTEV